MASHTARKNLSALGPAARALAGHGVDLVVAGGHRPQFAAEQGLDGLRLLGHVDDALLPGLYAGAEAFVLPSRYEGFGLPVLEAMASGTPVVPPPAGALPETCAGAARLAEPEPEPLRAALLEPARPTPPSASGCAPPASRARPPLTWERTARAIDALLQRRSASGSARRRPAPSRSPAAAGRRRGTRPAPGPRSARRRAAAAGRSSRTSSASPRAESHVYQNTRSIRRRLRAAASSLSALAQPLRLAACRSSRSPVVFFVLPFAAGQDSSVIQIGLRPSWKRRISRRANSASLITLRGLPVYGCSATASK